MVVWAIVVLAVLLFAMPGLAEGPQAQGGMGPSHGQEGSIFALQGCIMAIYGPNAFDVWIVKSNVRADLPCPGETVKVYAEEGARFYEYVAEDDKNPILFKELAPKDPVSVNGHIIITGVGETELWATQVTVNPYCPAFEGVVCPEPPE